MTLQEVKEVRVLLKTCEAELQAFVEAFHELPDQFIRGIDLDRWKGNGYRRALLR